LATITFTVKYPDGTPAPGATVKVMDMWETTTYASATTDSSGKCSITLSKGDYLVHAEKAGYKPSYSYYYDFSTDMSVELWLRELETPPPTPPTPPSTPTPTPALGSWLAFALLGAIPIFATIVIVGISEVGKVK
jgi:hypothetical protein